MSKRVLVVSRRFSAQMDSEAVRRGTEAGGGSREGYQNGIDWSALDRVYASRADTLAKGDVFRVSGGLSGLVLVVGGFLGVLVRWEADRIKQDLTALEGRMNEKMQLLQAQMQLLHTQLGQIEKKLDRRWW